MNPRRNIYVFHCNHYRYADVDDDTQKTYDFCGTLSDLLDVGKCVDGNMNICGNCWIKSL